MMRHFTKAACLLALLSSAAQAEIKHTPNLWRDAFTPLTLLKSANTTRLQGESDGEPVEATLTLGENGQIDVLRMMQDDEILRLPDSAWNGLTGAQQAWLEERGALTTLVVEGRDEDGDWRVALIFGSKQLRKRRLSREGQKRDIFNFYSRNEEMRASEPKQRGSHGRGFHSS